MNDLDTIEATCLEHLRLLLDEKFRILSDPALTNPSYKQMLMNDQAIKDTTEALFRIREMRTEAEKRVKLMADYKVAKAKGVV